MENHTAMLTDLSATVRTKHLYDFLMSFLGCPDEVIIGNIEFFPKLFE